MTNLSKIRSILQIKHFSFNNGKTSKRGHCIKIRLFKVFLCYLFILLPLYCIKPATAETTPNRISLAVSGGASKGAYEAGLIWGLIEVMRQVEKTENWAFGGEPRPIQIASIAGTSAEGINTLLAAMVWSVNPEDKGGFTNRINDNIFRWDCRSPRSGLLAEPLRSHYNENLCHV
jgi:hypothetical protein